MIKGYEFVVILATDYPCYYKVQATSMQNAYEILQEIIDEELIYEEVKQIQFLRHF